MSYRARARWTAPRVAVLVVLCIAAAAAAFWLTLPSAEPLRRANPGTTALMTARQREARQRGGAARHNQHWVPLARISPWLREAVVNSEDARFFEHDGIDVEQTKIALTTAVEDGRLRRGASTITQQLAKNLWLGEERTLWRKLREAILARRLERLGKRRILELYLNVAEWGDGIYGADAAARVWFDKPASELLPEESAVLAAMLPAPRKRNPHRPSAALRKRAHEVLSLYSLYHELTPEELEQARWRLDAMLGPP
ncbi:MAG TPA: monofunctional biosynthetic peptidoglycan transglycosylase [Myxococcales bacterium]|nr:monofunctional biosynthetic peptidoglycan transglycosylase [Myxococcales bacterium]